MRSHVRLFTPESDDSGLTVADVVSLYLSWLALRVAQDTYSADAYVNSRRDLESFCKLFDQPISLCRQNDLTRWLEANPQWKSAHTKKRVISSVVACFNWAFDEDIVDRAPYRRVKAVSELPYLPRRPAEASEYVRLMRKARSRPLRRALFFLRRTGARTCEMRESLWTDCQLDTESPHICLYRHKTHRKTGKPRKIGLDIATANWLRAMRRHATSPHVFTNCHGGAWDRHTFARHLRRWCERIGIDDGVDSRVSGACWRPAYAVDGVEAGVSNRQIADQLGHVSTAMVDRIYAAKSREKEDHLARVANDIQRKRIRRGKSAGE